jgi:hypothetical protein
MESDKLDRQQELYWAKVVDLKTGGEYIVRYRNFLGRWITRIAIVRAIASSASIGAWAVWRQYAFAWGLIIALAQVLDALKDVFPITRQHKAASELAIVLESLFIDAQLEWESILAGKYDEDRVAKLLHKLRTLHHNAECRIFRDGLPRREGLLVAAEEEAAAFFRKTYGSRVTTEGVHNGKHQIRLGENE